MQSIDKGIWALEHATFEHPNKSNVVAIAKKSRETFIKELQQIYRDTRQQESERLLDKFKKERSARIAAQSSTKIEGSNTMENSSSPAVVTSIVASTFLEPEFTLVSSTRLDRGSTGLGSSTRENEEEIKKSLEDDLLGLVGRMKGYAQNYKEQISRDNKILNSISTSQDKNLKKTEKEMKSLQEFEQMAKELGFWRLLSMGLLAIALFVLTIMFIFFTSFFR